MPVPYEVRESENRKVVAAMARTFDRKKAAAAFQRTRLSKTGQIDPLRVVNYRLSDDIFRRNAITPKGKNHGVVVFLDWSGSMDRILVDSVNQTLLLADFCRKVNVPFEVYIFSDNFDRSPEGETFDANPGGFFTGYTATRLVNVLSSRANRREHELLKRAFYNRAIAAANGEGGTYDPRFRLGGTPLESAVVASRDLIRNFKAANGVEIVNAIWLTDGQGSREFYPTDGDPYSTARRTVLDGSIAITEETTDDIYSRYRDMTPTLFRWLGATTGANIIGMFLHPYDRGLPRQLRFNRAPLTPGRDGRTSYEELLKEWNRDSFMKVPAEHSEHLGYDSYFLLNPTRPKGQTSATVDENATKTAYKNAVIREGAMRKAQCALMECVAEAIAKGRY
jgi:hypothetical protein